MMRYTFWHGRMGPKSEDCSWLNRAVESLQNNTWTTPLYVDGAGWDNMIRQEAAVTLFEKLRCNTSCSTLIFQNATLNEDIQESFSNAMAENKHLRSLTLRNLTATTSEETYNIPSSVFFNPHLESLCLVKTSLNEQACSELSHMVRNSFSLRSLSLDAVQIDRQGFVQVLAAIVMSSSITTLRLSNLEWTKQDLKRFFMAASFNRSITDLSMEGMKLDVTDAKLISKLLQKNRTIVQLCLRKNLLDSKALEILVNQGLAHNTTLKRLYLSRNYFGDEGAMSIVKLLSSSTSSLEELCLVDTKLLKNGCVAIARALKYNTGLRKISLDGNFMESCGLEILDALQHNMTLIHVLDRLPTILAKQFSAGIWKQVDFYLRANKAGRRFLRSDNIQRNHMPLLLQRASSSNKQQQQQPDVLFYFLRSCGQDRWPIVTTTDCNLEPRKFVPALPVVVTTSPPSSPIYFKHRKAVAPSA